MDDAEFQALLAQRASARAPAAMGDDEFSALMASRQQAPGGFDALLAAQKGREPDFLPPRNSSLEDATGGLARSGIKTYLGVKDLVGQGEDRDAVVREMMAADAGAAGAAGTVGEIVGDVAQMAIPAAGAGRVLGAASKLFPRASAVAQASLASKVLASPLTASGTGAGALTFAQTEGTAGERLKSAAKTAALTAGGGVVAGKILKGATKLPQAVEYLKRKGAYLTPGMAAESPGIKAIEAVMDVVPGLAKGTKAAREVAEKTWNRVAINAARPPGGADIPGIGQEGFRQLKGQVTKAYDDAWAGAQGQAPNVAGVSSVAARQLSRLGKVNRAKVRDLVSDIQGLQTPKAVDRAIRKVQQNKVIREDSDALEVVTKLRASYRDTLGADVKAALRAVDAKYPSYLAVKKAANAARNTGGEFSPKQLNSAGSQVGRETAGAGGTGPMMPLAREGIETVGKPLGGMLVNFMRRISGGLATPLPLKTMGNAVIGELPPQKAAAAMADALRARGAPVERIGAAYYNEE